ncbi:dTDP-4-dehydrorhamnose 3,5-epimerase [Pseudomonas protegens]|nr:dTDP-4-dehydrorhamnose 3,5-epimerase [Pseudomonas protegens]QYN00068.1 dTDP-4-dehydrorhamnose 3,5-epimerase [Pseudomonas protegens]
MKLVRTDIPEVIILEPQVFIDDRGWFMESFNEASFHAELEKIGLTAPRPFVQDNHSCSKKGVLRGLHYQHSPFAQGKLVRVTKGAAFDVVVDLRESSPTFKKSVSVELSADNKRMLWVPEGFAHGFVALEDDTHFIYKTTDYYSKASEAVIRWNDPELNISWPKLDEMIINQKDRDAPLFSEARKIGSPLTQWIDFKILGDNRGSLVALENKADEAVPFDVKRVYYLYGTAEGVSRGFHAHHDLTQVAICVSGKVKMVLDDGYTREEVWMESPERGLLIDPMVWHEMHEFSPDCVLLVLASDHYEESDYIRNYQDFIRHVNEG